MASVHHELSFGTSDLPRSAFRQDFSSCWLGIFHMLLVWPSSRLNDNAGKVLVLQGNTVS
jgi:hypothetical protein